MMDWTGQAGQDGLDGLDWDWTGQAGLDWDWTGQAGLDKMMGWTVIVMDKTRVTVDRMRMRMRMAMVKMRIMVRGWWNQNPKPHVGRGGCSGVKSFFSDTPIKAMNSDPEVVI